MNQSVTAPKPEISNFLSGQGNSIPLFKVFMSPTVIDKVSEVLLSGYIGQGPKVDEFEKVLTPWVGNKNVLTLNSGTSALHLALRLAGAGYGDEVISTPMTCMATNVPIVAQGAKIVWADIDPNTGNIDPKEVEKKITKKTKAIMAVHWGGYPCELEELRAIGQKHGVKVIEDAAHAFGASYKGTQIGGYSDFTCFSLQAIKHVTTVDGGILTTKADEDYKRGKLLRWYGIDREGERKDFRCEEDVVDYGYKFHMNDVTAAIGIEQMNFAQDIIDKHRANAAYYNERLKDCKGVQLLNYKDDRVSSYWLYTIKVEKRLEFMQAMKDKNIVVSQVHARNDKHSVFKDFRCELPGVEAFTEKQVSIPVGWWLSKDEIKYIADCVCGFYS
jgi:dTDP-4-amino-4,6-dideoxygalactose transaminase